MSSRDEKTVTVVMTDNLNQGLDPDYGGVPLYVLITQLQAYKKEIDAVGYSNPKLILAVDFDGPEDCYPDVSLIRLELTAERPETSDEVLGRLTREANAEIEAHDKKVKNLETARDNITRDLTNARAHLSDVRRSNMEHMVAQHRKNGMSVDAAWTAVRKMFPDTK